MSPRALVLAGGRRTAVWPLVVAMGRDLRAAGYQVTVASLYPPSDEVVAALGVGSLVTLEPDRWVPADLPAGARADEGAAGPAARPAPAGAAPGDSATDGAAPVPSSGGPATATGASGAASLRRRARRAASTAKKHGKAFVAERGAWHRVRATAAVMDIARAADIVVAADPVMVRAAWEIGQQVPRPAVVLGPAGVAGALAERAPR
jgi:hypothetical protein